MITKKPTKGHREARSFLLVFPFLFRKEKGSEARSFLLAPSFLFRKEKVGKTTNKSQRKDAAKRDRFFWPYLFFFVKKR